jgi:hypothetical protein
MSEPKKNLKFKCSVCGQEGHNKRTCPTTKAERLLEPKPEVKQEPQVIYALEFAEDNGDSVYRNTKLYASLSGLMNGLRELMTQLAELHEDDELSEDDESLEKAKVYDDVFYFKDTSVFKDVPIPAKEDVEQILNREGKYKYSDGLMIKIGSELGGATCFACEISVHKKTLNP